MKGRNHFSSLFHQIKHAYFILKMDKWWLIALKRAPNKPPKKQQQQQSKLILYILIEHVG